jgi:hypothetical protein
MPVYCSSCGKSPAYCTECGGRLDLYVVGVCPRCDFDLTGRDDDERDEREARTTLRGVESPREGTEA